jgi:hypothetical protein
MEEIQDSSEPIQEHSGPEETAQPTDCTLVPDESAPPKRRLLGALKGLYTVPDDIKTMFAEEIEEMFYGYRAQHKFDHIEEAAAERLRRELDAKS